MANRSLVVHVNSSTMCVLLGGPESSVCTTVDQSSTYSLITIQLQSKTAWTGQQQCMHHGASNQNVIHWEMQEITHLVTSVLFSRLFNALKLNDVCVADSMQ